jgi:hypothetical protein
MKPSVMLTIASLLSILFSIFHLADDMVHGMFPGGLPNIAVVLLLVVWLYATLLLTERRSGYVIILVLSLFVSGVSVLHMRGAGGMTAGIKSGGGFFFAFTLFALDMTALLSVILSVRGLWNLKRQPNHPT